MSRKWRTLDDGRVEVNDDGDTYIPSLLGPDKSTERVEGWRALFEPLCELEGVPITWALAFCYAESGGKADAISPAGAVGLLQVMPRGGLTKELLLVPQYNAEIGIGMIGDSRRLGWDLPSSASRYNAGMESDGRPHPSQKSPWGMREDKGYIMRVVEAQNYWRALENAGAPTKSKTGLGAPLMLALFAAVAMEEL